MNWQRRSWRSARAQRPRRSSLGHGQKRTVADRQTRSFTAPCGVVPPGLTTARHGLLEMGNTAGSALSSSAALPVGWPKTRRPGAIQAESPQRCARLVNCAPTAQIACEWATPAWQGHLKNMRIITLISRAHWLTASLDILGEHNELPVAPEHDDRPSIIGKRTIQHEHHFSCRNFNGLSVSTDGSDADGSHRQSKTFAGHHASIPATNTSRTACRRRSGRNGFSSRKTVSVRRNHLEVDS
jgi:hypothetical protein